MRALEGRASSAIATVARDQRDLTLPDKLASGRGCPMSLLRVADPIETTPLPPAPPRHTAFAQTWRIAMTRPVLFFVGMGFYGLYGLLPLVPPLINRSIFNSLSGRHLAVL